MNDATVFSAPYEKHRILRSALAPFFGRNMILTSAVGDIVRNHVERFCNRLEAQRESQQDLNIGLAFKCLVSDIITEYALGTPYRLLDTPDFSPSWFEIQRATGEFALLAKHFPKLIPVLRHVPAPLWFVKMIFPGMGKLLEMTEVARSTPRMRLC